MGGNLSLCVAIFRQALHVEKEGTRVQIFNTCMKKIYGHISEVHFDWECSDPECQRYLLDIGNGTVHTRIKWATGRFLKALPSDSEHESQIIWLKWVRWSNRLSARSKYFGKLGQSFISSLAPISTEVGRINGTVLDSAAHSKRGQKYFVTVETLHCRFGSRCESASGRTAAWCSSHSHA